MGLRKLLKEGWTTGHLYVHPAVCIQFCFKNTEAASDLIDQNCFSSGNSAKYLLFKANEFGNWCERERVVVVGKYFYPGLRKRWSGCSGVDGYMNRIHSGQSLPSLTSAPKLLACKN
ncbi:uncharacterized protein LOC129117638 [Agelaius phoeniceus]|uniref:uncharacterized protein LOC129117638 n=1 Tax=Agelaius phoeniceus TaxID=39638 RepID=UPI0040552D6D